MNYQNHSEFITISNSKEIQIETTTVTDQSDNVTKTVKVYLVDKSLRERIELQLMEIIMITELKDVLKKAITEHMTR